VNNASPLIHLIGAFFFLPGVVGYGCLDGITDCNWPSYSVQFMLFHQSLILYCFWNAKQLGLNKWHCDYLLKITPWKKVWSNGIQKVCCMLMINMGVDSLLCHPPVVTVSSPENWKHLDCTSELRLIGVSSLEATMFTSLTYIGIITPDWPLYCKTAISPIKQRDILRDCMGLLSGQYWWGAQPS